MSDEAGDVAGGPGGPPVDAALIRSVESVREFLARPGYAFSNTELLANVRAVHAALATMNAAYLGLLAEVDTRPDIVPGARAGQAAKTFLQEALRVAGPQASRDVRAATAIASAAPELPAMGQALTDGLVSRDHLDVAVSTLGRIPKALKTRLITPTDTDTDTDTDTNTDTEAEVEVEVEVSELAGSEVKTGAQVIDELFTAQSQKLPPSTVDILGRQIIARLDPDRAERFDADAYQRRSYAWSRDFAGMGVYKFVLDPVTDAIVQAAINAWSAPRPAGTAIDEHGRTRKVTEERTATQRKADAIADLIQAGAATRAIPVDPHDPDDEPTNPAEPVEPVEPVADQTPAPEADATDQAEGGDDATDQDDLTEETVAADQPPTAVPGPVFAARPCTGVQVVAVATLDQLAAAFGATDPAARTAGLARISLAGPIGSYSGATLAPETLARLACDSPIRRILIGDDNVILDHGRAKRYATDAQRRALAIRDQGCIIPGCICPPDWCEAHHIITWENGGRTDLNNLALLCSRHHTAHHAGIYDIELRDGLPWVRLPAWQDITRPWMRNTTHADHHHTAEKITRQLTDQPPLPWDHPGDAA